MLYHLAELTVDEIKLIGHALGKLPHEIVAQFLGKLQGQISAQEAAQQAAAPPPEAPTTPASGAPAST